MSIIEFIQDRARYYNCPVCGRNLRGCRVRMLNHVEDRYTVQVTCGACQVMFVVILSIQGPGLEPGTDPEMDVDLEETHVIQVEGTLDAPLAVAAPAREPIASDEVLDVHLYLKRFEGSLTDLLKHPDHSRG